jgi:hypothetical protein
VSGSNPFRPLGIETPRAKTEMEGPGSYPKWYKILFVYQCRALPVDLI